MQKPINQDIQTLFSLYIDECRYVVRLRPETIRSSEEAFRHFKPEQLVEPNGKTSFEEHYKKWLTQLEKQLANI